jgi:hypothetical protein
MPYDNSVLSLNPDGKTLLNTETALRANNFEVLSVSSPIEARFELEMGRCGVFLTSYITPSVIYEDLAKFFRRSCPGGLVFFLSKPTGAEVPDADIIFSEQDEPHLIVERIRSNR